MQHPSLIAWPESPAPFYGGDPLFRAALGKVATSAHTWVVAGSIGVENAKLSPQQPSQIFNSAALVSPERRICRAL